MVFCTNCGSSVAENIRFCSACGTPVAIKVLDGATPGPTVDVQRATSPLWYVTYATGQRGGPFSEEDVRAKIARQEIKITDSVIAQGGETWVPITQSPFAVFIATQANIDRLASSTCPQCGSAMIVVLRRSGASKAFFIVGLLTIWMFGFGVIFLIIGYIIGRNPAPRYECPRCKYKAR